MDQEYEEDRPPQSQQNQYREEDEEEEDDQPRQQDRDAIPEEQEPAQPSSPTLSASQLAAAAATVSPTHSTTSAQQGKAEVKILETAEDIQERRETVLGRYAAFKSETKVKREKLEDSRRFQYFKRDADELESWIYEKLQAASDETFKDATNLQAKIQKHQVQLTILIKFTRGSS